MFQYKLKIHCVFIFIVISLFVVINCEHQHSEGGGDTHHLEHHSSHGSKEQKGYKDSQYHDLVRKGNEAKDYNEGDFSIHGGKENKHLNEGGHYAKHHQSAEGQKGAKFGEKKGHKKGHKTKGYHNKFFKDEYHREHKFYDDAHKEGHHSKYGKYHANQNKKHGGYKKGGHHNSGYHDDHYGRNGHHNKGKHDTEHIGHNSKHGFEKYHNHGSNYHKDGGHQGGKHFEYIYGH